MVMVRWVGVCAGERLDAWDRATARSMDAAVANRCAAPMNASASWELSVPSAWRSSAAIRANILSSVIAPNYSSGTTFRLQPRLDPGDHVIEHLSLLRLVEHLVVQPRIDLQLDI